MSNENDKKSFILYNDYSTFFEMLSDEEAGRVIKNIFAHQNDESVQELHGASEMLFAVIKQALERDSEKWAEKKAARSEAGKAGAEKRWKEKQSDGKNSNATNDDSKNSNAINATSENSKDGDTTNDDDKNSNAINDMAKMAVNVSVSGNVNDSVNVTERGADKPPSRSPPKKCFQKPTVAEVAEYCKQRKSNIDPESFVAFYESKGWFVGKNKMKDWQAAVRTWERRDNQTKQARASPSFAKNEYDSNVAGCGDVRSTLGF